MSCEAVKMAATSKDGSLKDIIPVILENIEDPSIKNEVEEYIKNVKETKNTESETAGSWLDWARSNTNLKIVSFPIPIGVLPKDYSSGELLDVKVSCRGPDDAVYDKYQKIRQRVARGNCFLHIDKGKDKGFRLVLYGLKKFTGGLGDDDDRNRGDNHTWKRYFTKSLEAASRIVATKKANGEAAHLSCVRLGDQLMICAGSKNVHILFRKREDIKRYHGDRFRIAGEICEVIMDILDQMEASLRERLLQFLAVTGYTAIFEILSPDHQHVEDLSYLQGNELKFITWTSPDLDPAADGELCTLPPHIGIEIARALGLPTVDYDIIPVSEVETRMIQIRQGYQTEGEVLYFLDERGHVMGLLKKKSIWYIICRAIREKVRTAAAAKIKNASMFSIGSSTQKMEKRLRDIQTWLGLEDETLAAWKTLAVAFLKWSIAGVDSGSVRPDIISDKFPVLWKRFLEETGNSDKISHRYHEPGSEGDASVLLTPSEEEEAAISS